MSSIGTITAKLTADTAEFKKGLQEAGESLDFLKHTVEALGIREVWLKITETVNETTEAYAESERALRRVAAVTSGMETAKVFQELAHGLSDVTTFSEPAIMEVTALLGKFNLTDRQIGEMLPKLADFAVGTGTDMAGAAERMGRAIATGNASVRLLGIDIGEAQRALFKAGDETERYNILVDAMSKFQGQAGEEAKTASGAHKQLSNAYEELYKTVGEAIDQPVANFFRESTERVKEATAAVSKYGEEIKTAGEFVGFLLHHPMEAFFGKQEHVQSDLEKLHEQMGPVVPVVSSESPTSKLSNAPKVDEWAGALESFTTGAAKAGALLGMFNQEQQDEVDNLKGLVEEQEGVRQQQLERDKLGLKTMGVQSQVDATTAANLKYTTTIAGVENALVNFGRSLGKAGNTITTTIADLASGNVTGAVSTAFIDLASRTKEFAELQGHLETIMNQLSNVIGPLIGMISSLADNVVSALSFFGLSDNAASQQMVTDGFKGLSSAIDKFKGALIDTNNTLNAPNGFKVKLAEYNSIISTIPANALIPPTSGQPPPPGFTPAPTAAQRTATAIGNIDAGYGVSLTPAQQQAAVAAAQNTVTINVNANTSTKDLVQQITDNIVKRTNYILSGSKTSVNTRNQYGA